jgi:glycosyltransferase involved in cell wall biosynthesis
MIVQRGSRAMRVCGLVPYPLGTTPSQRFRLEQWAPHLVEHGIQLDLFPFADRRLLSLLRQPGRVLSKAVAFSGALVRRLAHLVSAARYDAVVIHRAVCLAGPALLERLLSLTHQPILFDFDDAIFRLHTSSANRRFGWLKCPGKTATLCRLSHHVLAGNSFLADYARQFNPNVSVIPTSIDTDRYRVSERTGGPSRVVVGWTGSSTSQTHLELFTPVLREFLRGRNVELRVVSDREPVLPDVPFVWRRWDARTEVQEIARFDVGIMPMPDEPWSRGKCALKALQYMALGIPAVCSAVGTNCEVVRHGENGFLAQTPGEWSTHLASLVENVELRRRLGTAARRTVERDYSAVQCARQFAEVLKQTLSRVRGDRNNLRAV